MEKYRTNDFDLKRDSDIELSLNVDPEYHSSYIHTHRYFFTFLDFWMNFAELQDRVFKQNMHSIEKKKLPSIYQKTRCKLNVCFHDGLDLIFLLNQHSEEAIIFTTSQFKIKNHFAKCSTVDAFTEHGIYHCGDVDDYDCLLDIMNIFCKDMSIFRGYRVSATQNKSINKHNKSFRYGVTSNYYFLISPIKSILSRLIDIKINVYCNLSCYISNSVPNFVVMTELVDVELSLNAEFYRLMRGVLEQNIGEQFSTNSDTIPNELINKLFEGYQVGVTSKYATFCFRMILNNAQFNFLVKRETELSSFNRDDGTGHEPFARMELNQAKISFDFYIDGQYELYLICQSIVLFDSRFEKVDPNVPRPNVFTSVMSSRTKNNENQKPNKGLMFEAHISVKKDEAPVITLVILNARVLLIFDWLIKVKDFLLQTTEFVAPHKNSKASNYLYEIPKEGVLVRSISNANTMFYYDSQCNRHEAPSRQNLNQSFTLKITLKEMDMVLIENIEDLNSLALVGFTTGVLTAYDFNSILEGNFEIQKMNLCWCSISIEENCYKNVKKLTNDFSATIVLTRDIPQTQSLTKNQSVEEKFTKNKNVFCLSSDESLKDQNHSAKGIHIIDFIHKRQKIMFEFSDKIEAKFSFNDICGLTNVISRSMDRLNNSTVNNQILRETTQHYDITAKPSVSISKICMKCFFLSVCILDDTPILTPIFRLSMKDLTLQKNIDRLNISMKLCIDYFNEVTFGYDPILETWLIEKLAIQWRDNHINLDIIPNNESVFNINLTQTFMTQFKRYMNKLHSTKSTNKIKESYISKPSNSIYRIYKSESSSISSTSSGLSSGLMSFNATLFIPAGIGVSVISKQNEELIYLLFRGVKMHMLKQDNNYQFNIHVDCVQADNQLLTADKWQFFNAESKSFNSDESNSSSNVVEPQLLQRKNSNKSLSSANKRNKRSSSTVSSTSLTDFSMRPALSIEINFTPTNQYNTFELFRVQLCDSSILLEETLLWKIIQLVTEVINFDRKPISNTLRKSLSIVEKSSTNSKIPNDDRKFSLALDDKKTAKLCYFGVLELKIGNIVLSALAVNDNSLPPSLKALKKQLNIKLVSFGNALVSIASFQRYRFVGTFGFLFKSISEFYLTELKKQKLRIVVTMDAFGNPMGLATDFKDSIEGLLFEGDVGGFVFGLGYGVTNSISKVASSMSQGVGFLTFDEQHEKMRRRMLRNQSQAENATALSHLYGGVKGLGVGVFGGLTAIAKNTYTATQKDGVSGLIRGVTTGAVDTVTKPLQGALDLLEGTASAFKEAVGSPLMKKSQFSDNRLRLPRVCTNLQLRLPPYSADSAEAQQILLRIKK